MESPNAAPNPSPANAGQPDGASKIIANLMKTEPATHSADAIRRVSAILGCSRL